MRGPALYRMREVHSRFPRAIGKALFCSRLHKARLYRREREWGSGGDIDGPETRAVGAGGRDAQRNAGRYEDADRAGSLCLEPIQRDGIVRLVPPTNFDEAGPVDTLREQEIHGNPEPGIHEPPGTPRLVARGRGGLGMLILFSPVYLPPLVWPGHVLGQRHFDERRRRPVP